MFHVEQLRLLIILSILAILNFGCSPEDPNPELKDEVRAQLTSRMDELKKDLESAIKMRNEAEGVINGSQPNSLDLKLAKRDWLKANVNVDKVRQELSYIEIKLRRRIAEDRFRYRVARKTGTAWPPEDESRLFKVHQDLVSAPKTWDVRVPKLADRIPASVAPTAEKKEEKK